MAGQIALMTGRRGKKYGRHCSQGSPNIIWHVDSDDENYFPLSSFVIREVDSSNTVNMCHLYGDRGVVELQLSIT